MYQSNKAAVSEDWIFAAARLPGDFATSCSPLCFASIKLVSSHKVAALVTNCQPLLPVFEACVLLLMANICHNCGVDMKCVGKSTNSFFVFWTGKKKGFFSADSSFTAYTHQCSLLSHLFSTNAPWDFLWEGYLRTNLTLHLSDRLWHGMLTCSWPPLSFSLSFHPSIKTSYLHSSASIPPQYFNQLCSLLAEPFS